MGNGGVTVSFAYTRSQRFFVYTRSKDSFLLIPGHQMFSCLYQVIRRFLAYTRSSGLIPGHQIISWGSALFTPVGASWAGIPPKFPEPFA